VSKKTILLFFASKAFLFFCIFLSKKESQEGKMARMVILSVLALAIIAVSLAEDYSG
jgi:hypothetical protein